LVSFRFMPVKITVDDKLEIDADWLSLRMADLEAQVTDLTSSLYQGKVTLRIDVTWGVSNNAVSTRQYSPYMGYSFQPTSTSDYERCKATHRCGRAWEVSERSERALTKTRMRAASPQLNYHNSRRRITTKRRQPPPTPSNGLGAASMTLHSSSLRSKIGGKGRTPSAKETPQPMSPSPPPMLTSTPSTLNPSAPPSPPTTPPPTTAWW